MAAKTPIKAATAGAGGNAGGMNKGRTYDLSSTNIAGLGTDLEKAVRKAASECEKEVCLCALGRTQVDEDRAEVMWGS